MTSLLRRLPTLSMVAVRWASSKVETKKPETAIVYTAAREVNTASGFKMAGYGIHWFGGVFPDRAARFSDHPVTLTRAQMQAMLSSLQLANHYRLERLQIVTEAGMFLRYHRRGWVKADGTPVANAVLYSQIVKLLERIDVIFTYLPTVLKNPEMEVARQLAVDGLAYPKIPFELDTEDKADQQKGDDEKAKKKRGRPKKKPDTGVVEESAEQKPDNEGGADESSPDREAMA